MITSLRDSYLRIFLVFYFSFDAWKSWDFRRWIFFVILLDKCWNQISGIFIFTCYYIFNHLNLSEFLILFSISYQAIIVGPCDLAIFFETCDSILKYISLTISTYWKKWFFFRDVLFDFNWKQVDHSFGNVEGDFLGILISEFQYVLELLFQIINFIKILRQQFFNFTWNTLWCKQPVWIVKEWL